MSGKKKKKPVDPGYALLMIQALEETKEKFLTEVELRDYVIKKRQNFNRKWFSKGLDELVEDGYTISPGKFQKIVRSNDPQPIEPVVPPTLQEKIYKCGEYFKTNHGKFLGCELRLGSKVAGSEDAIWLQKRKKVYSTLFQETAWELAYWVSRQSGKGQHFEYIAQLQHVPVCRQLRILKADGTVHPNQQATIGYVLDLHNDDKNFFVDHGLLPLDPSYKDKKEDILKLKQAEQLAQQAAQQQAQQQAQQAAQQQAPKQLYLELKQKAEQEAQAQHQQQQADNEKLRLQLQQQAKVIEDLHKKQALLKQQTLAFGYKEQQQRQSAQQKVNNIVQQARKTVNNAVQQVKRKADQLDEKEKKLLQKSRRQKRKDFELDEKERAIAATQALDFAEKPLMLELKDPKDNNQQPLLMLELKDPPAEKKDKDKRYSR